jgi:hypothetical protein
MTIVPRDAGFEALESHCFVKLRDLRKSDCAQSRL